MRGKDDRVPAGHGGEVPLSAGTPLGAGRLLVANSTSDHVAWEEGILVGYRTDTTGTRCTVHTAPCERGRAGGY